MDNRLSALRNATKTLIHGEVSEQNFEIGLEGQVSKGIFMKLLWLSSLIALIGAYKKDWLMIFIGMISLFALAYL